MSENVWTWGIQVYPRSCNSSGNMMRTWWWFAGIGSNYILHVQANLFESKNGKCLKVRMSHDVTQEGKQNTYITNYDFIYKRVRVRWGHEILNQWRELSCYPCLHISTSSTSNSNFGETWNFQTTQELLKWSGLSWSTPSTQNFSSTEQHNSQDSHCLRTGCGPGASHLVIHPSESQNITKVVCSAFLESTCIH